MPYLPQIISAPQSKDTTDTFYGYNHKLKIGAGEMYHTENLSTRDFPMLSTRKRRGWVDNLGDCRNILDKDALAYVKDGTLYYDGEVILTPQHGLTPGQKQLVKFGAYVLVFPDKIYVNTKQTGDQGNIEASFTISGTTDYSYCTADGEGITPATTEPQSPTNGQYWYDSANNVLKCWSGAQQEWVTVVTPYTKITFNDFSLPLGSFFKEHDAVTLSGTKYADVLDGEKILYGVGNDVENNTAYIIVVGLIPAAAASYSSTVYLDRTMPQLDYIFECQNRLWGCRYGLDEKGQFLNEIYCSALGDFKNWRQYMGLSTDSWTASVGSDGPWTGGINYLGTPMFFKENVVHRVTVSATGGHRLDEMQCRGVMEGCSRSLAVIDEKLIYKSRNDFCIFQGGFPESIGMALGDEQYSDVTAGVYNSRYYASMKDHAGDWHLFVYDSRQNLWIREDSMHAYGFAWIGNSFYAIDDNGDLWDLAGYTGTTEQDLHWTAQTGILHYFVRGSRGAAVNTNRKYTSRYSIQMTATKGSTVAVYVRYDSDGIWRFQGEMPFSGLNTVVFPIRPRRCDHLEIKIEGQGDAKIYGITRYIEEGSDI